MATLPCAHKRKYKTEGKAVASAARAMAAGRAGYLRSYRCHYCQQYHLTKQPTGLKETLDHVPTAP